MIGNFKKIHLYGFTASVRMLQHKMTRATANIRQLDKVRPFPSRSSLLLIYTITNPLSSSTAIENVQDHLPSVPKSALAYYYFVFNDREKHTLETLFQSLFIQLLYTYYYSPSSEMGSFLKKASSCQRPDCLSWSNAVGATPITK